MWDSRISAIFNTEDNVKEWKREKPGALNVLTTTVIIMTFVKCPCNLSLMFSNLFNAWLQRISIPPPRRKFEIPEGSGAVKDPGNSRGKED